MADVGYYNIWDILKQDSLSPWAAAEDVSTDPHRLRDWNTNEDTLYQATSTGLSECSKSWLITAPEWLIMKDISSTSYWIRDEILEIGVQRNVFR